MANRQSETSPVRALAFWAAGSLAVAFLFEEGAEAASVECPCTAPGCKRFSGTSKCETVEPRLCFWCAEAVAYHNPPCRCGGGNGCKIEAWQRADEEARYR